MGEVTECLELVVFVWYFSNTKCKFMYMPSFIKIVDTDYIYDKIRRRTLDTIPFDRKLLFTIFG